MSPGLVKRSVDGQARNSPAAGWFRTPGLANSSASPTASSTTGRAPDYYGRPSPSARQRTKRRYSYHDVLELKSSSSARRGVSLQMARRAVECLRLDLGADLASRTCADGTHSVWPQQRRSSPLPVARRCSTSCRVGSRGRLAATSSDRAGAGDVAAGPVPATSLEPPGVSGATPFARASRRPPFPARRRHRALRPPERRSSPRSLTFTSRWLYEPVEFALHWDDDGRPRGASAPTSGCPSSAASSSSHRRTALVTRRTPSATSARALPQSRSWRLPA